MKKILLAALAIFAVFTLSACSKGYTNISNSELVAMLDDHPEYQFIDVRTNEEFYTSRIAGFKNLNYYFFMDDYSMLDDLDKDIPVVIMCNSGNRSVSASNIFVDLGFKTVYNLENGIEGWDGETT